MTRYTLMLAALLSGCTTEDDRADAAMKLMQSCYRELAESERPYVCDDALAAYRRLDMQLVDTWKRVELRLVEGAIAERMP